MFDKIKDLCAARGMTIAELERQADIVPTTMAKWRKITPSVDKVARVAKALGVTIEDLLEDPEEAAPADRSA